MNKWPGRQYGGNYCHKAENRKKRMKRNEDSLKDLWNNIKCTNICIIWIPELQWRRQWQTTPVLLPGKSHGWKSLVGYSPWGRKESDTTERLHFHFHFHALEKEMATHSGVLAWRIPGMGEPGGLPSMGSHRVGHDWSDLAVAVASAAEYIMRNAGL